jgi:hypothetical protein
MGTLFRFCGPTSGCHDRGNVPCEFVYFVMPIIATRLLVISSRCHIEAPLVLGDHDPWRARRRTDRSYVVPPCAWLGGEG